eukprot:COSAG02_NODE_1923_length_10327_cov_6.211501_16_plen_80_part_00
MPQQQQQQQQQQEEGIEWAAENVAEVEEKEEELWVDPSDGNAYSLAAEDHIHISCPHIIHAPPKLILIKYSSRNRTMTL